MIEIPAVIAWYDLADKVLICIDKAGERRTIPSEQQITVTMNEVVVKTMSAHFLSLYKFRGHTIERIAIKEEMND